MKILGKC
ncbi:hypothetical protein CGLO_00080 [Colletotrichum gloeosporioides Cg-14]|nr:hypothetical protein CGLO_00080 [Colletotrichum gloeosporioides Cg-14]